MLLGFLFLFGFGLVHIVKADGASLLINPNAGTYSVGSTFDVSIFVNTDSENINAVEVNLNFDPTKIQVANPTGGKSFIQVWVAQPSYSNTKGTMSFIGGIPSPGIKTSSGLVSTVTFRAIAPGETTITFSDSSKVLRNDSEGTNILTSKGQATYSIILPPPEGPQVFSPTHPDQNKWYKDNNPTFSWTKEDYVTDYSYMIDKDASAVPDNISEGSFTSVSYGDMQDGIWYFHIKAEKNNVWGGTSNYAVKIDKTAPAIFAPTVEPGSVTVEKQPLISFITTDALSGLDYYQLKYLDISPNNTQEDAGFFTEVSSPYKLPPLGVGEYLVVVRAYDVAGNWQEGAVKIKILPSSLYVSSQGVHYKQLLVPLWLIVLIFLILLVITIYFYLRRHRGFVYQDRDSMLRLQRKLEAKQKEVNETLNKIKIQEDHYQHSNQSQKNT